ncbi:MAG: alpha amylase C-terminal domain-containing protein, partial [Gammaproteobacteria bacterium]|nr:alpha amylase C-terminal domain-containing protein [Gammaproteobacteria bacterium]
GDEWQRFANLRLCYAFMFAYPGKKLLFMGDEFGQGREWNHNAALDWDLLERELHQGVATLVGDVNHLYRSLPALHRLDNEPAGFEWIDCDDRDNSVIAFTRRAADAAEVVVVCNFTPVVRHGYRIGMPRAGRYAECLNSDARQYAGRGIGNLGAVQTEPVSCHGHAQSVELSLPPLGALWFVHEPQDER